MTELLDQIARVRERAARTYTPEGVEVWMNGRKRSLEDRSPVEAVEAGEFDRVMAMLASYEAGGFV